MVVERFFETKARQLVPLRLAVVAALLVLVVDNVQAFTYKASPPRGGSVILSAHQRYDYYDYNNNNNNNNRHHHHHHHHRRDEDLVAKLPLLEAEYATECNLETEHCSELTEDIENAKTSAEFGVRAAQLKFYEAFSNQNLQEMAAVWSTSGDVRCVHPGAPSLEGYDAVLSSWAQMFSQGPPGFEIQPVRTRVDVSGQTAVCSCIEETTTGGALECLNIYRRENGGWKMVTHMASPIVMIPQRKRRGDGGGDLQE